MPDTFFTSPVLEENPDALSNVFAHMLDYLPPAFNVDPIKNGAFTISSSSRSVKFSIQGFLFYLWLGDSFQPTAVIDYRGLTISALVAQLQTVDSSLTCNVMIDGSKSALRLLDTQNDISGEVWVFTNPVWAFYKTLALEVMEAKATLLEAIRQMSIVGATGFIQDYWGEFSNISRQVTDTDPVFGQKILADIKQPKSNNKALEIVIKEALGLDVSVIDLGNAASSSTMYMNDTATPINETAYCLWNTGTPLMYFPASFGVVLSGVTIQDLTADQLSELTWILLAYKASGLAPALVWEGNLAGYSSYGNYQIFFIS